MSELPSIAGSPGGPWSDGLFDRKAALRLGQDFRLSLIARKYAR